MSKAKQTSTCIQCEGDELLGVRDSARQFTDVLDVLMQHHYLLPECRKPEITAAAIVDQLCKAEKDQRRLCKLLQDSAERTCKEADELIVVLNFPRSACNREKGSVHLTGGKIMLEMSDLLQLVIDRVRLIVNGDRGLLEGRQPHNDVDFLADIWKDS